MRVPITGFKRKGGVALRHSFTSPTIVVSARKWLVRRYRGGGTMRDALGDARGVIWELAKIQDRYIV